MPNYKAGITYKAVSFLEMDSMLNGDRRNYPVNLQSGYHKSKE